MWEGHQPGRASTALDTAGGADGPHDPSEPTGDRDPDGAYPRAGRQAGQGGLVRNRPGNPDGTPVAMVAAVQELGSPAKNIPPRLGMRATAMRKWEEWKAVMLKGARAVLAGAWKANQVMDAVGAKAAGDIAKHITEVWEPPLKQSTVKARARRYASRDATESIRKPLVDTARMISSLTHTVENDK